MQISTLSQLVERHYGKDKDDDVSKIKDLYQKIGIDKIYKSYEEESYGKIEKLINDYRKEFYIESCYSDMSE